MKAKNLLMVLVVLFGTGFGTNVQAQFHNALNFHQTTQFLGSQFIGFSNTNWVTVPNSASQNFSELTVELWVKPDINQQYIPVSLISKTHAYSLSIYGMGYYASPDQLFCHYGIYCYQNKFYCETSRFNAGSNDASVTPANTKVQATQQGSFETGKWYHVAATFSNSAISLYVNGVLQQTVNPSATDSYGTYNPIFSANYPIVLGFYSKPSSSTVFSNYFEGTMDELRIWNYVRTAQQIIDSKDIELNGTETGLAAYYNFNQGNANQNNAGFTTLIDKTANANHGTLSSGTGFNFALSGTLSNWITSFAGCSISTNPATIIAGGGFTANWTTPSNGLIPSRYYIDLSTDPAFSTFVTNSAGTTYNDFDAGNVTSLQIHNLQPSTNYYYRVRADISGTKSDYSSVTKVTTIAYKSQTITFNAPFVKKYGDADFVLASSSSGLPITYSALPLSSSITINGTTAHINSPGSVMVTANQGGNDIYAPATAATATYAITKGNLLVKATNINKLFNSAVPDLICSYTGLANGDLGPDNAINLTTNVQQNTPVGIYPAAITALNTDFNDSKYIIYFTPGDVTIAIDSSKTNAAQTITFNAIQTKSMGDADFAPVASASSGLPVTLSSSNTAVATIVNGKVHIVSSGTCTIYANQAGVSPYFQPAVQASQSLTVSDNNVLSFDGVDDYVTCGNFLSPSYTKEAWIRLKSTTGYINIISGSLNHAFWVVNGQLCSGHNQGWFYVVDKNLIPANTWTHVAVTYDAYTTTMKLYTNGVLAAVNAAVPAVSGDNSVQIGAYGNGTLTMVGDIDEVKIYNKARNASEIQADKSAQPIDIYGLLAYYDMNQGISCGDNTTQTSLANKANPSNNGVIKNMALTTGCTSNFIASDRTTPVVTDNTLNFDGTDDFVDLGNNANLKFPNDNFSLSVWFKTTQTSTARFISNGHFSWSTPGYALGIMNGNVFFGASSNLNINYATLFSTTATFNDGYWHHVAAVSDATGKTMKIYVDGALQSVSKFPGTWGTITNGNTLDLGIGIPYIASNTSNVVLGKSEVGNNEFFNGTMEDVSFWNAALSQSQIQKCYSRTLTGLESNLVAYYKMNQGIANGNNTGTNTLADNITTQNNGVLTNFALNGTSSNWVDGIQIPAAPTVSAADINFLLESISNLSNTLEFSVDGGSSWISVPGTLLGIAPYLSNTPTPIQLRYKATPTSLPSFSATVYLPAKPQSTPAISGSSINFLTKKISLYSTMQYSTDGGLTWKYASSKKSAPGISKKAPSETNDLDLTPYLTSGVNLLIRNEPTATDFGSEYVSIVIPGVPDAPTDALEDVVNNTFGFALNPIYPNLWDYEFSTDGGTTYQILSENPITIGSQALAAGSMSVRVAAVASVNFAGLPLQNVSAYNSVATALKNTETSDFAIYPNPATDYISVSGAVNSHIAIYDLKGRMLLNEQADGKSIDIHNLAKGIYVVKVVSEYKQKIGKLVKE